MQQGPENDTQRVQCRKCLSFPSIFFYVKDIERIGDDALHMGEVVRSIKAWILEVLLGEGVDLADAGYLLVRERGVRCWIPQSHGCEENVFSSDLNLLGLDDRPRLGSVRLGEIVPK